jgi:hypothetical protein
MARRSDSAIAIPAAKKPARVKPVASTVAADLLPLPYERDETTDKPPGAPRKVMKQAATDIANGLKDTDRGAQVNQTYLKLKREP